MNHATTANGSTSAHAAVVIPLRAHQKIVEIPSSMSTGKLTALRGLAIGSVISSVLLLLLTTNIATFINAYVACSCILAFLPVCLALMGSCIVLHNTGRWVETDVCCNIMRPKAACCTRCCMSYKSCCARTSSLHIAGSVFSGLALFGLGFLFIGNVVQIHYDYQNGYNYNGYRNNMPAPYYDYGHSIHTPSYHYAYYKYPTVPDTVEMNDEPTSTEASETKVAPPAQPESESLEVPPPQAYRVEKPDSGIIRDRAEPDYYTTYYTHEPFAAGAGVVVQQIFVGLCAMTLMTTMSVSAFLLRKAENEFVAPMLLPPGKMIVSSIDQVQSLPAPDPLMHKVALTEV